MLNSLPALATRNYNARCLVAVDVSSPLEPLPNCETAIDVLIRLNNVGEKMFRRHVTQFADHVIRPEVGAIPYFDFSSPHRLLAAGRAAGRDAAAAILDSCCRMESGSLR